MQHWDCVIKFTMVNDLHDTHVCYNYLQFDSE